MKPNLPLPVTFVMLLLLGICAVKSFGDEKTFELKQALEYGIKHSPSLDIARKKVRISKLALTNGIYQFFPVVHIAATNGIENHIPFEENDPSSYSNYRLSIEETLYDNGKNINRYRQLKIKNDIAELTYKKERDRLCHNIATHFLEYHLRLELFSVYQKTYALLDQQYQIIKDLYHQGLKTRKDFLRLDAGRKKAEIDLLNQNNEIRIALKTLFRFMGIDARRKNHPFHGVSPRKLNPERFLLLNDTPFSVDNNLSIQIMELNRKLEALNEKGVQRERWPQISLASNLAYQNNNNFNAEGRFDDHEETKWDISLNFKYTLWDWGTKKRDAKIAHFEKAIIMRDIDSEKITIQSDVSKLSMNIEKLKKDFELNRELLKLENKTFSYIQSEYRQGKIAYLDMIQALNKLSEAKEGYFTASHLLKTKVLDYWYHKGELYEKIF